ncbi:hypothetical protein [Methylibium rhizosphaerae]|uniref:hypothetical protein n=1 Tax=Methylibium rhizosphaerae TaxID=2570323 RepID=UPI0015E27A61|nr:hypothetical protein [Methylibium rhizosphaerae]
MQVTVDREVLNELQYLVALHRKHGAANPFNTVEDLVAYVLACVADGARRPGAWERSMLESMGLVAHCGEHERYRARYGDPADPEEASPMHEAVAAPCCAATECDDAATAFFEILELLSRAVAALHSVRCAFDTPESRDASRRPREAAALQQVYRVLGKPWPANASRAAE